MWNSSKLLMSFEKNWSKILSVDNDWTLGKPIIINSQSLVFQKINNQSINNHKSQERRPTQTPHHAHRNSHCDNPSLKLIALLLVYIQISRTKCSSLHQGSQEWNAFLPSNLSSAAFLLYLFLLFKIKTHDFYPDLEIFCFYPFYIL